MIGSRSRSRPDVFDRFNASLNALVSGQASSVRQAVATPGPCGGRVAVV